MEIQLTKTKTITIGGGAKARRSVDIVGIELFGGDSRGCPAVRLREKKGVLKIVAAGFIPPPNGELPTSWEDAAKACTWSLPPAFQAPHAAICVTSPDMFLSQTTAEAFKSDLSSGGHKGDEPSGIKAKSTRVGLRRPATVTATPTAAPTAIPDFKPGLPVSNGGTRFVMKPLAGEQFIMEASLPEYQVLWLSRLLPEGRRPTARSIQLRPSALTASILHQPSFTATKGTAIVLFLGDEEAIIAGYRDGDLVLFRNCRESVGWRTVREAVKSGLGLEEDMIDGALTDNLIDPRSFIEPAMKPLLEELAMCRDYLVGKLGIELSEALLVGPDSAATALGALIEEHARLKVKAISTFDELDAPKLEGASARDFAAALGAALAVMDEEKTEVAK